MVGKEDLGNATALNSAVFNGARIDEPVEGGEHGHVPVLDLPRPGQRRQAQGLQAERRLGRDGVGDGIRDWVEQRLQGNS